jgi:hypothetical protein
LRDVAENIEFLVNGKKFVSRYGKPAPPHGV